MRVPVKFRQVTGQNAQILDPCGLGGQTSACWKGLMEIYRQVKFGVADCWSRGVTQLRKSVFTGLTHRFCVEESFATGHG